MTESRLDAGANFVYRFRMKFTQNFQANDIILSVFGVLSYLVELKLDYRKGNDNCRPKRKATPSHGNASTDRWDFFSDQLWIDCQGLRLRNLR